MASVWLVEDLKHHRQVALKVLRPELSHALGAERFQREIHLAARLQHPHVCSVYDSGELIALDPGGTSRLWFTMPFVEGESLRDRLEREGRLPLAEALRIAHEAAQALQYAHDKGVVHRDVKPENLLLASDGATLVADFGIARPTDDLHGEALTATGVSVGTPAYMAPEQVTGDRHLDGRADQYALATTVFEMLAGRPPFVAATGAALIAQRFSTPVSSVRELRPDVPAHVDAALMRAMSLAPEARFGSVSEFVQALEHASGVEATSRRRVAGRHLLLAGALLLLLGVAVFAFWRGRAPVATGDTRIAVLPFAMFGDDSTGAYLAEGLADEVTTSLAQVRGLRVASRSAAAHFVGRPVREAAAGLGVDAVMEGSVRRAGDRLRVSAQLTSSSDGLVLWAKAFDRPAGDVFALQEDIARAIVGALRDRLGATTTVVASAGGSVDPVAYDLFLRGRYFWSRRGSLGLRTAVDYFSRAIARDSMFARARAGIAMAYVVMPFFGGATADSSLPLAEVHALGALRLDSTLADAHLALGNVRRYQWRWEEAERHLRRAVALAPDDATAHQWLGGVLYATGRIGEAMPEMREARRLDPYSAVIAGDFVYALTVAGDTAMVTESARVLELDTLLAVSHAVAGLVSLRVGQADAALRSFATARRLGEAPYTSGFEVAAMQAAGRTKEASAAYAALLRTLAEQGGTAWDAANAAVAMGDVERTFALLEHLVTRRESIVSEFSLPCDQGFAALHSDRRFGELLARAGMQPCRR
jgi:TolB-like protein/tetratricopeptide (TPR) repeat protein